MSLYNQFYTGGDGSGIEYFSMLASNLSCLAAEYFYQSGDVPDYIRDFSFALKGIRFGIYELEEIVVSAAKDYNASLNYPFKSNAFKGSIRTLKLNKDKPAADFAGDILPEEDANACCRNLYAHIIKALKAYNPRESHLVCMEGAKESYADVFKLRDFLIDCIEKENMPTTEDFTQVLSAKE